MAEGEPAIQSQPGDSLRPVLAELVVAELGDPRVVETVRVAEAEEKGSGSGLAGCRAAFPRGRFGSDPTLREPNDRVMKSRKRTGAKSDIGVYLDD